jgi:hypothetical protein
MGHIHLGVLPRTKPWIEVVGLLEAGAAIDEIAAASANAAEHSLLGASANPVFVEAVRLLISIPIAARSADFGDALRRLDLDIGANPSFFDVLTSAAQALDRLAGARSDRTDFTDLSSRALSRALTDCVGTDLPGLFSPNAEDVRLSFQKFSRGSGMSVLCQSYFSALVGSSLSYWLDRVLAGHVGAGKRFQSVNEKAAFDQALDFHVSEATRIIREFSSGWVGKTLHTKGSIQSEDARNFGHVCLRKVVEELREKRGRND